MNAWTCWNTLLGRALARVFRCQHDGNYADVRLYRPGTWLNTNFFIKYNVLAVTIGDNVCRVDQSQHTLNHETVHVFQFRRLGPLFLPVYYLASFWAWIVTGNGYWENVFEQAARDQSGEP